MNNKSRYIAYIRKSTDRDDAQAHSIEAQKRELEEYVERHNINVVEWITEAASAYRAGRPKFNEMLQMFEEKKAEGILTYHLTRLARNSKDGGNIIYMMGEEKIQSILTPSGEHTGSSDDLLIMQIHFAMAKKSSDDTKTFVKRDIKTKILKGEYPGRPPLGYINVDANGRIAGKKYTPEKQEMLHKRSKEEDRSLRRIEIDPIDGVKIQELIETYASGKYTLEQLADYSQNLGLISNKAQSKLSRATVHGMLKNPFYYGAIQHSNELIQPHELPDETRHFPLISYTLFQTVQSILKRRSSPKKIKHLHTYRGLFQCGECGCQITSEVQRGHIYYRCSKKDKNKKCSQKYVREETLEVFMKKRVKEYEIPTDNGLIEWALNILKREHKKELDKRDIIITDLRRKISLADTQRSQLIKMKISSANINGELISNEEYKAEKQRIANEKQRWLEQIRGEEELKDSWIHRMEDFFDFGAQCIMEWDKGIQEQRRFIFLTIFGSNTKIDTRNEDLLLTKAVDGFCKTTQIQKTAPKGKVWLRR